jgi:small conductance mechanosensitive channel
VLGVPGLHLHGFVLLSIGTALCAAGMSLVRAVKLSMKLDAPTEHSAGRETAAVQWNDVTDFLLKALEHIAVAAAILVGGYLLALIVRAVLRRWLRRHEPRLGPSFVQVACGSAFVIVLVLTAGLALIALGVPVTFVAAALVLILVVLFIPLHESVADLAATVVFLLFRPFKKGELIETMGHLGVVQEIWLFNTVLRLADQRVATLPNSKIREDGIVNYTRTGRLRVDFGFTIAFGQDLDRIHDMVTAIVAGDTRVLDFGATEIGVDDITETGVRILVAPTVAVGPGPTPADYWGVCSDLREQIIRRFDTEGIRFATLSSPITINNPTVSGRQ